MKLHNGPRQTTAEAAATHLGIDVNEGEKFYAWVNPADLDRKAIWANFKGLPHPDEELVLVAIPVFPRSAAIRSGRGVGNIPCLRVPREKVEKIGTFTISEVVKSGALARVSLRGLNLQDWSAARYWDKRTWDLSGWFLERASLPEAGLSGIPMIRINLARANLTGASLNTANMTAATLRRANLTGAKLRGSNLTGADLSGADLAKTDFLNANLTGADLRSAKNIGDARVSGAKITGALMDEGIREILLSNGATE